MTCVAGIVLLVPSVEDKDDDGDSLIVFWLVPTSAIGHTKWLTVLRFDFKALINFYKKGHEMKSI